nr:outer membrane beta-barrel protein [Cytophagales bacterium]
MKQLIYLIIFFASLKAVSGQHYDIGLHAGALTPMDFITSQGGSMGLQAGILFMYHFDEKLAISSDFLVGYFAYNASNSNSTMTGGLTKVHVNTFGLLIHRKFQLANQWVISVGTGVGYYLEHTNPRNPTSQNPALEKEYVRDFTMPFRGRLTKEFAPNLRGGIHSGIYLTPFYSLGGFHLGPEISYRF